MNELEDSWVLEYSVSQDCFNVDTKNKVLSLNKNAMYEQMSNDYKIIEEFPTQSEALMVAKIYRERLERYKHNED